MKNIRVLDCTLRDGGRIIDCAFPDEHIKDISYRLTDANVDIIELGFLRNNIKYNGNSTFFTDVDQIRPYVIRNQTHTMYVVFVDYGMFDFSTLKRYDGTSIDGIRVGFVRENFLSNYDDLIRCLRIVKTQGYKLFIQGVNSLGYSDSEFLQIIDMINEIKPYSFGIVDTYGAMYVDDVQKYYHLVNKNMDKDICIDFHSHNNFQLSFAFAQEIIGLSKGERSIIIDATLNGMGKCAGNLCLELIVDFLIRKMYSDYDLDGILDIIDDYMYGIKKNHSWGYSIPAMMAGIYKSHPNNVIYLTDKYRLTTKEIKYIISTIEPAKRQRYDYDNIQRIYIEYNHTKVDDRATLKRLSQQFFGKDVLLLVPGHSLLEYADKIDALIREKNPQIISVNFVTDKGIKESRLAFFGSEKRYKKYSAMRRGENVAIASNIVSDCSDDFVVNYESLIERESEIFDNTMIMLLNLLKKIGVTKMQVAGYDGFTTPDKNYFDSEVFDDGRFAADYHSINRNVRELLGKYVKKLENPESIQFITPSVYADIFSGEK